MNDRFAFNLIADRAAMTAAGDVDHAFLQSMRSMPLRLAVAQLWRISEPVSWRVD
jgi:hypothetical protein